MAVTGTKTVQDIVTAAFVKSGISGFGDTPPADEAKDGMDELNVMLKGWQAQPGFVWAKERMSLTLSTASEYTLNPVRPLEVLSARLKRSGIETPMTKLTGDEYDLLPNKSSTGLPTQFYYDRQKEAAKLYVWPVLATANGETVEITYTREVEDITSLSQIIDVPAEWWDAVIYNLAARLQETAPMASHSPLVPQRAQALLDQNLAFDQEDSVFFYAG